MQKVFKIIILLVIIGFNSPITLAASPDEGMWLPMLINKNYDEMKKYYLMAIYMGNIEAMANLGNYYQQIELNNENMIKYYKMAIDNGYYEPLLVLKKYYEEIEDYEEMKKYFYIAINNGNIYAMEGLGNFYQKTEFNPELMKKSEQLKIN